jgi:hypothetical protein
VADRDISIEDLDMRVLLSRTLEEQQPCARAQLFMWCFGGQEMDLGDRGISLLGRRSLELAPETPAVSTRRVGILEPRRIYDPCRLRQPAPVLF